MIGINLENVHKTINDDLNDQISKLKYDVNKNNRELTEYINKLKVYFIIISLMLRKHLN